MLKAIIDREAAKVGIEMRGNAITMADDAANLVGAIYRGFKQQNPEEAVPFRELFLYLVREGSAVWTKEVEMTTIVLNRKDGETDAGESGIS